MEILANVGLQLTLASNGQKAVDIAKKQDFDAVLMDK